MPILREIALDLWVAETPLRYFVEMGRRMTVVRLANQQLFLHSPVPLTDEVARALAALGEVSFVIPASSLHGHLFMEAYADAYPSAELFAAPGLATKRDDLEFVAELGDEPDRRWSLEIDQTIFRGARGMEEVIFFHPQTRSLIVGDTCFNIERSASFLTRLWAWGPRMRPTTGPTPFYRLSVRDKQAADESLKRVLEWDFDRLIVGHGAIIESGGKEAFRRAWEWVG